MDTEKELADWRKAKKAAFGRQNFKSFVLVAVGEDGDVSWGAQFDHKPQEMLRKLDIIRHDIAQHIKRGAEEE